MRIFVTGATGFIGSAVVPELIEAGHHVVGLARSDRSAQALGAAGAHVQRGTLDDLEQLRSAAAASDGVIHLAFKHEEAFSGNFPAATAADRRVIETLGDALAGSGRPLVIASGLSGHPAGVLVSETNQPAVDSVTGERMLAERLLISLASSDVRSSSVRLAPTVHGQGDPNFVAALIGIARQKGFSGYIAAGANHWPAVHRLDAARLFRLAFEQAPAGTVLHGVAEEGVSLREIAETIGRRLKLPTASIPAEVAAEHFGWLAGFAAVDIRASSALTRELLSWQPTQPGLIEDLERGHYFLT